MKIIASATGGGSTRLLPPSGNFPARCFQVIHTGHHFDQKYGKMKDILRVSWELVTEKAVFKDGEPEKPFVVNKKYNLSLGEKATLRKDLESYRGKTFTDEELKGFDVSKLINTPCMLQIIHNKVDDNVYANISAIGSIPKGYVVDGLYNDTLLFSVSSFNKEIFDTLPDFIKTEIMESEEMKDKPIETDATNDAPSDDLPF